MNNHKPIHGKWNFDIENRKKFPDNFKDQTFHANNDKYVQEAIKYVDKRFADNVGDTELYLPIDHASSKKHVKKFLKERLTCFGDYQDAIGKDISFGCHSVISPMMNIGLITPKYVIEKTLKYSNEHKIPYSSLEAFIRQIIGWREYMRYVYQQEHNTLIHSNYFNHKNKLPKTWLSGTTGIEPVDSVIKRVLQTAYAHHIERLMILGNVLLLYQIHPKHVHDWFMTMFIDSYHVFMEPNVYGMSQYSSGALMTNRPYFSSDNYILKMSDFTKRSAQIVDINNEKLIWTDIIRILYYYFVNKHRKQLLQNYMISSSVHNFDKLTKEEKIRINKLGKYICG
jgi:deoxyribodipyrimidine photolyase-related protein